MLLADSYGGGVHGERWRDQNCLLRPGCWFRPLYVCFYRFRLVDGLPVYVKNGKRGSPTRSLRTANGIKVVSSGELKRSAKRSANTAAP